MRTSSYVRPALTALFTAMLVASASAERTTIPLASIEQLIDSGVAVHTRTHATQRGIRRDR